MVAAARVVDRRMELGRGLRGHYGWVSNRRGVHARILTRVILLVGNAPDSRLNSLPFRRGTLTLRELLNVEHLLHLLCGLVLEPGSPAVRLLH